MHLLTQTHQKRDFDGRKGQQLQRQSRKWASERDDRSAVTAALAKRQNAWLKLEVMVDAEPGGNRSAEPDRAFHR